MDVLIVLLGGLLLLILTMLALKRKAFVDKINALPGPPSAPIIGNLLDIAKHNFETLAAAVEQQKEFPNGFRFWIASFPYVVLNTVESVEAVLSSVQHIDKSNDYSTLHPWLRSGLLTSKGAKWHARRRLLTPTFHFRILDQFLPVFNRNTTVLVKKLAALSGREAFNLGHYVHLCTLDTICESAMGTTVNAQEDSNSEYVQAVKTACCNSYMRLVKPWLYPNATFYASPSGWSFSRALKVLHGLTKSVIHKRRGIHTEELMKMQQSAEDGTKLRVAFLDQLLMANHNGAGLSDVDIQEEVDTFMFEGHDTTGCAITFILYALSVNPEIQEMAYREVTSVVGDETRHLTNQDLAQMKYLERVIKEGMRLYPSVPVFGRSIKEDLALEMDGKRVVPAGATVAICPYVLHRKESLWPDPERFDPDRFLPENSVGRHAFAYLPFSAGPRNCIGQKFAMLEMKCVIARLLMELRFIEAYPGYKPEVAGELILKSRNEHVLVRVEQRHL